MNEKIKLFFNFNIFIYLILKLDYSPYHEAGLAAFNLRLMEIRRNLAFCKILYHSPKPCKIWRETCHMLGF